MSTVLPLVDGARSGRTRDIARLISLVESGSDDVPDVMREIERTVRAAAPFPVPARLGKVTYTDTWLWDKSGQFQLDTLTEGQL